MATDNTLMSAERSVSYVISRLMLELEYKDVKTFAETLGCDYYTVYHCFSGRTKKLSPELIGKIKSLHPNVNIDFLVSGKEPVFKSFKDEISEQKVNNPIEVTPLEMMKLYDRLTVLLERVEKRETQREAEFDARLEHLRILEEALYKKLNE